MAAQQPQKEPTEAELYAAEEKKRAEELAAKANEAKDSTQNPPADVDKPKEEMGKPKPAGKTTGKPATSRPRPTPTKRKERIEVYEQRGPKGLFKVTRNIDTGKTDAELIEE